MNKQEATLRGFWVRVRPVEGISDTYRLSYMPRGLMAERAPGGKPRRVPEYHAQVKAQGDAVIWDRPPVERPEDLERLNNDALNRVTVLHAWLANLTSLISSVRDWSAEFGWSTKIVDKPMEDSEIGEYKAPALLLQAETTRVLLEPVAREAPGAHGVVDLYLMPAYDDIASLYYDGKKWHIHYVRPGGQVVANIREVEPRPLSKVSLRRVLEEMKSHAE